MIGAMLKRLDDYFLIGARGSSVGREARGAVATFLTMGYILFVNPDILAAAGVPQVGAMTATALAAGICCIFMGLYANFPIALASGMGLNAVVAFQIATAAGSWQAAMGLIVLDGLIILLLVLSGLREAVLHAIPRDLRLAIGAGIGLFIAFIGLVNAGLILPSSTPGVPVRPGPMTDRPTLVALFGLLVTAVLMARQVKGALIIGIAAGTLLALPLGVAKLPERLVWPSFETIFAADLRGALQWRLMPLLFAVIMVDFFDTLGTVTAISYQAGLSDDQGRIPGLRRLLIVDSVSASVGGICGASSVTSYIESASGVAEGARTGLHSVVVGLLFLVAIVLAPLAGIVPKQATAPALILVGFLMIEQIVEIRWTDLETSIPAFLTLLTIPLTFHISHGLK